jgi:hypothetical protein
MRKRKLRTQACCMHVVVLAGVAQLPATRCSLPVRARLVLGGLCLSLRACVFVLAVVAEQ